MNQILSFNEWVLQQYDYNKNGKIDRDGRGEYTAYKKALNNKNYDRTKQAWQEYVALTEALNKNEREQQNQQALLEQQSALLAAAGEGNATAATLLTGDSKEKTAKSVIIIAAVAAVAIVFLLKRK